MTLPETLDNEKTAFILHASSLTVGTVIDMPHEFKIVLKHIVDNIFWAFLVLMIIAGSMVDAPFVNVGLTAR